MVVHKRQIKLLKEISETLNVNFPKLDSLSASEADKLIDKHLNDFNNEKRRKKGITCFKPGRFDLYEVI